jgi:hypothetical protein
LFDTNNIASINISSRLKNITISHLSRWTSSGDYN